jgi:hypothetical protein
VSSACWRGHLFSFSFTFGCEHGMAGGRCMIGNWLSTAAKQCATQSNVPLPQIVVAALH